MGLILPSSWQAIWVAWSLDSPWNSQLYFFLWLHLQHMKVPGPGIKSKLQLYHSFGNTRSSICCTLAGTLPEDAFQMCMFLSHSSRGHSPEPYWAALWFFFWVLLETHLAFFYHRYSSIIRCVRWYSPMAGWLALRLDFLQSPLWIWALLKTSYLPPQPGEIYQVLCFFPSDSRRKGL